MARIGKFIARLFSVVALVTMLPQCLYASARIDVDRVKGVPSWMLLGRADNFLRADVRDSALIYYSIVAMRYAADLPAAEQRLCARADIGLWNVYFYYYYDIARQYEHLSKAESILRSMGEEDASLYLDFGAFYQNLSPRGSDPKLKGKAMDYYSRAYATARRQRQEGLADMAFTNMIIMASENGRLVDISAQWNDYRKLPLTDYSGIRRYNLYLYRGLMLMAAKRYAEAAMVFKRQWHDLAKTAINNRYLYISRQNLAKAYAAAGHTSEAIATMMEASGIEGIWSMTDIRLEIYSTLADYYRRLHNPQQAYHYTERYYELKDSVLNYQQLNAINETKSLRRLNDISTQLSEASQRSQLYGYMLVSGAVILLLVAVLAVVLYSNNRRLNRLNRLLYEKSKTLIAERETNQRKREMKQQASEGLSAGDEAEDSGHKMYADIMERAREYMETSDEIYEPDFTVAKLAAALGLNSHYVSDAINRGTGGNFSALLGRYRIIEVCRRLRDEPDYKNMTIEAMSLSVGFKSRTSFISAFKRTIGMTPSVYLRYNFER